MCLNPIWSIWDTVINEKERKKGRRAFLKSFINLNSSTLFKRRFTEYPGTHGRKKLIKGTTPLEWEPLFFLILILMLNINLIKIFNIFLSFVSMTTFFTCQLYFSIYSFLFIWSERVKKFLNITKIYLRKSV